MKRVLLLCLVASCSKGSASEPGKTVTPPAPRLQVEAAQPVVPPATSAEAYAEGQGRVEGQGFVVEVLPPTDAASGKEFVCKVVLKATGEYHLNAEFPTSLKVTSPAGVTVQKPEQKKADAASFSEREAVFEVRGTSADGGAKAFAATFRFAVCTATTCDPKNAKLAWNVDVK